MLTLAIDSNIMYIQSAIENGHMPKWVQAIGKENVEIIGRIFELKDKGLINVVLPRRSWFETIGANEDAEINEENVHFMSDRLRGKIIPPGGDREAHILGNALRTEKREYTEFNNKMQEVRVLGTAMSEKDVDDAEIMADCLVYNKMLVARGEEPIAGLVTVNFRDFIGSYRTFPKEYVPSESDILNEAGNAVLQDNIRLRIEQFAEAKGYPFTPPLLPKEVDAMLNEVELEQDSPTA